MAQVEGYKEFNQWVYERFFAQTIDTYSHIASIFIDVLEAENNKYFCDACDFLRECNWCQLCYTPKNDIPLYLGLIAIQLVAASSRQDDDLCTSAAYNPRLCQYLSGMDDNKLQAKYRDAQENIYRDFENWCNKHHFSIYLAKDSTHYRYIQYPLSLALLHKKDLASLPLFFHKCGLAVNDEIDFEWFMQIIMGRVNGLPPNIYQKWNRLIDTGRREAILKQIYSSYLNWDGQYEDDSRQCRSGNSLQTMDYSMYWAPSIDITPEFYCNWELVEFPFCDGCFFIQDSENINDWDRIKDNNITYSEHVEYAFVHIKETPFSKDLYTYFEASPFCYEDIKIFRLSSQQVREMIALFPEKFKGIPSLRLTGGIKLNNREWMEGAGPVIVANDSYTMARLIRLGNKEQIININIAEQPLIHLSEGRYFLRYNPEMPAIHFKITFPVPVEDRDAKGGWCLGDNGYHVRDENSHVHGLDFSQIPVEFLHIGTLQDGNAIRLWMELAVGVSTQNYDNENIIHKALRRSIDGIRNR